MAAKEMLIVKRGYDFSKWLLKDRAMFDRLCDLAPNIARRDMQAAGPMIRDSAIWHLKHITQGGDPFEMRQARPLDYGHWSAHKLEPLSDYQLRHGEAVAIGVAIDTVYSSLMISTNLSKGTGFPCGFSRPS